MSRNSPNTYDPGRIIVSVNGIAITGFAEDSILTLAPLGENNRLVVGADGELARSIDRNKAWTLTLSLLQTAGSNDVLSLLSASGAYFLCVVQDASGRTLFTEDEAFCGQEPDVSFGAEIGEREWTIIMPRPARNIGGNAGRSGLPAIPAFPRLPGL